MSSAHEEYQNFAYGICSLVLRVVIFRAGRHVELPAISCAEVIATITRTRVPTARPFCRNRGIEPGLIRAGFGPCAAGSARQGTCLCRRSGAAKVLTSRADFNDDPAESAHRLKVSWPRLHNPFVRDGSRGRARHANRAIALDRTRVAERGGLSPRGARGCPVVCAQPGGSRRRREICGMRGCTRWAPALGVPNCECQAATWIGVSIMSPLSSGALWAARPGRGVAPQTVPHAPGVHCRRRPFAWRPAQGRVLLCLRLCIR